MRLRVRVVLFAAILLAGLAWVAASDGEHATVVRHLLRHLLRNLF